MKDNRSVQDGSERQSDKSENSSKNQSGQQQNTSGQQQQSDVGQGQNPQDGDQWNNYRTRELSGKNSGKDHRSGL